MGLFVGYSIDRAWFPSLKASHMDPANVKIFRGTTEVVNRDVEVGNGGEFVELKLHKESGVWYTERVQLVTAVGNVMPKEAKVVITHNGKTYEAQANVFKQ